MHGRALVAVAPDSDPVESAGSADPWLRDLHSLLLIRHFEQTLLRLFSEGRVSGTTHTCLGQEYIPVALVPLLRADDMVFSNHRGHGHYLARYDDPSGLLAEITGREGAICGGVGGSQHIQRPGYLSTGVQGESLPVAAGAALRLKRAGRGALALVFIGDGTWGEGAVYEALNVAALWKLPLMVVVENNGIAQSTPTASHLAGSIAGRVAGFGAEYLGLDGCALAELRARLGPVVDQVREGNGPAVVEFVTHRIGPHSKGDDVRGPADREIAAAHDWYEVYRAAAPDTFDQVEAAQRDRLARIVADVLSRPESVWTAS